MALTRELIIANTSLSGLTDEQINALVTLSTNDENDSLSRRTGEIYGKFDEDIKSIVGVEKNGTEKTYDYFKRALNDYKANADKVSSLSTKVNELNKEKTRLEGVIAKGGNDSELSKKLNQAEADLAKVTSQYTELNTKFENAKTEHEKEMFGMMLDNELRSALKGVTYKGNLPENVVKLIEQQAISKVKSMHPAFEDNGNGGKILVFHYDDNAPMRNKENKMLFYSAEELLKKELKEMDVLDEGRQQPGGGTKPTPQVHQGGNVVDISGAKNQIEACDIITQSLISRGITPDNPQHEIELQKAWSELNVSSLPER